MFQMIASLYILLSSDLRATMAGTPGSCDYQSPAAFDSENGVNCTSLSPDQCVLNADICVLYNVEERVDADIDMPQATYYHFNYRVGGTGGDDFNFDRHREGIVIARFEVWQGDYTLHGIRITYSDGQRAMAGSERGSKASFDLDVAGGEFVNALSVWGNGAGTRTGAFKIETNKRRSFFPQMTKWGLKTEYKMEYGGGLILGVRGRSGNDIDCLGFMMIRDIESMQLGSVQYDLSDIEEAEKQTVFDIVIPNPSYTDSDSGYDEQKVKQTKSYEFGVSATFSFSYSFSVSAGIPNLVQAESGFEWSISTTSTYQQKVEKTEEHTIRVQLIAPKRTKQRIYRFWYEGTATVTWNGRMYVKVDNGAEWSYAVSGTYIGVDATFVDGDSLTVAICDPSYVDVCHWIDVEPISTGRVQIYFFE